MSVECFGAQAAWGHVVRPGKGEKAEVNTVYPRKKPYYVESGAKVGVCLMTSPVFTEANLVLADAEELKFCL